MSRVGTSSNPDCTLSAPGYGTWNVPLVAIDFGPTIVATEDMARDNRIFYPMQAQLDTFSISAIFAQKVGMNAFNRWMWRYAEFASTPGSNLRVGMRVQVPAREFDYMGFPVQGWSYHFAPLQLTDWTWVVSINFDGATPTGGQVWVQSSSFFGAPPDPADPDQAMFYPSYYDTTDNKYTGDPTGKLYGQPKKIAAPTPKPATKTTATYNTDYTGKMFGPNPKK